MHIELKKFGDILTSREAGREAYLAFLPTLKTIKPAEEIVIDFQGVAVLTPSWADEFIRPIIQENIKKVSFTNDTNPSIKAALRFANPDLDLDEITVSEDKIIFDEKGADEKTYASNKPVFTLTFPYADEEAINILINNKIKKIDVYASDTTSDIRLRAVIKMLHQAVIEGVIKNR